MHIVRLKESKRTLGIASDSGVYARIRAGEFTKPVAIGKRAVGWPSTEIEAILNATVAGYSPEQMRELVKQLHAERFKLSPMLATKAQTGAKWSAAA